MPRDSRLFQTYPIDFHRHPKVTRLSDAAFRAFVSMNGEARIAENDGVFSAEDAEFEWGQEALDALTGSHPTRPLVLRVGDTYVIRDYAEHQFTKADREDLREKRSRAGKASAEKRSTRAQHVLNEDEHPATETESESEDFYSTTKSQSSSNRARVSTDAIPVSDMTRRLAAQKGISSLRTIVDAVGREVELTITADQAFQLSTLLLEKARKWPDNPQAYVLHCIRSSKAEVEQHLYQRVGVAS